MIFYACLCKIQCFRFCLHFFWIILGLLTFLLFIIGVVFGVLGLVGKDGVDVFNYVLSSENLSSAKPKIFSDKTAGQYLNICLNGKLIIIIYIFISKIYYLNR